MSAPDTEFLKRAVFLVDASSYVFRAYYAIQRPLHAPDGTPTHATFGFLQMVQALLGMHELQHCVLVWDLPGKGFRHQIYPEYKANRTSPPEDLSIQITNAREATKHLGLPEIDCVGFEADDILATLVRKNPGSPFVIVTADKDLLQLVGPDVWCLDTMKDKWSNVVEAKEKFGVEPDRISQVQALCGDSVDNVPGVPGVGPKTAAELIQTFGTLDEVLKTARVRMHDPDKKYADKLKGKCLLSVASHEDDARVSFELVKLREDVPVDSTLESLKPRKPDAAGLRAWGTRLGFGKTATKLLEFFEKDQAKDPASAAEVEESAPLPAHAPFGVELVKNLTELKQLLESQTHAELVAMDTETLSLDHLREHNLVGLSLSFGDDLGYYVPLRHRESEANLDVRAALDALSDYFRQRAKDPAFAVVFQNAKFDLHALANDDFRFSDELRIDDTMVASFVLDPSAQHGLDAMSVKHLLYKPLSFEEVAGGLEDFSMVPLERATFYAAEDAVVCRRLWHVLKEALAKSSLWMVYDGIDRPVIPILVSMERAGIILDPAMLKASSRLLHAELAALQTKAIELLRDSGVDVAPDLNLNSNKQIAAILYEKLNLPVLKRGKTGPSTDVKVLEELAAQHPFPEILLEIREIAKLLSTYVDSLPELINPRTGRIHTDFSQTIAATGRLSSSNPNLQNIPIKSRRGREIRKAFKAAPGHVFVGVDYSQIELRLLAHVSQDPELVRAFKEDADIHKRTAALILGKPEAKTDEDDRRIAKTINYGIVYGQTAFGLSKMLRIPRGQAQAFIDGYFKTYSGIRAYMDAAIKEAKDTGAVRTLSGRRRPLPEIHSSNGPVRQFGERMAINSPLQGLAADLMKVGMIAVVRELKKSLFDATLLLQVHDELVFEVPQAKAEALRRAVTEILEDPHLMRPFGIDTFSVIMKAESAVGSNWGEI